MHQFLAAILFGACACAQSIVELSTLDWTLSNGINATVAGNFPSQAHLDLYAAGVIGDPLYGFNDVDQLWVERSNWTWTSKPITGLKHNIETWLVFDGLDTFAEIKLCGKLVANVANQFRQFTFDVTNIISECSENPTLSLNFGSAAKIVLDIAKTTGPAYINGANHVSDEEFTGKIYMRKQQSDFGWDWSPSVAPAGPWRSARFVQLAKNEPVHIHNTLIDIYRKGQMNNLPPDQSQPWVFNASIDFLGELPRDASLHLTLFDSKDKLVKNIALGDITSNNQTITGNTIIKEPVDLWWPYNLGDPSLYRATIYIKSKSWHSSAVIEKRVGFRTIVLNLSPITDTQRAAGVAPGSNWHFEVNGHEFYAKGSNLVPPDVFWPRVNETKMRDMFEMVVHANQNMLRVWSSGAYLSDEIYDLADEMGILLWSEFEFSDSEYPVLPDWMETYEAEAYYNVRRINHHPSLALWAGGNELEAVLLNYFFDDDDVVAGYEKLFLQLLIKCVYANSRSISYIPSSTYNGYLSLDFNSTMPQTPRYNNRSSPDAIYSDTDMYNYDGRQAFNLSSYPVGRFADEFGFISFPSLQSWREAVPEDQLSIESDAVLHHNRHVPFGGDSSAQGIAEVTDAIKLWYPAPNMIDPIANFSAWCWSSQVFQADMYANEIAFYRRGSAMREQQLGTLYWQLEDLWVAPTWSSIEANGRPKVSYYAMKDIFEPVIVWPFYDEEDDSLEIWVISDSFELVSADVSLQWMDYHGKALTLGHSESKTDSRAQLSLHAEVLSLNATNVITYPSVSDLFASDTARANALLSLTVTANGQTHSSYFHPSSLKDSNLQNPKLEIKLNKAHANSSQGVFFTVTAESAVAAWVWIDWPSTVKGYFDNNGFWLNKGESRTVYFKVLSDWTGDGSWVQDVTVRSMWDNKLSG